MGNSFIAESNYGALPLNSDQLNKRQGCHHIETSQLICRANQLISFYMMATLTFNELKTRQI